MDEDNEMDNEKNSGPIEEESFAELFEQTQMQRDFLKPGQKIEAVIVKITPEWIFIDLGGKTEGHLDRNEFVDDEGQLTVKEGDAIVAYFLSSRHSEKLFTTKIGAGDSARVYMEDAWRSGIPVEGFVEKEIKGGFEIKLPGGLRGFCPFSQMGLYRVENAQDYIGRRVSFRIMEYGEKGRNIILSSRAILEEERKSEQEALRATLKEGMVVTGTVVSIRDFGAFLDIGGLQALLPISEIGWGRIENIQERLSVGQTLDVKITRLDFEKNRISLSLRQTLADPWDEVAAKYPEGSLHTGTVSRLATFGAFVNLEPGVDGLIHISKLGKGRRIAHPRDAIQAGESLVVRVDTIDREKKRISLSIPAEQPDGDGARKTGENPEDDYKEYVAKAPNSLGSFGDILKGKMEKKRTK